MVRVYADMVGDLFHYGHVAFLRQARALGDRLIVGVHSDEVVESYKRKPVLTMRERVAAIEGCRYADEVIPDAPLEVTRAWVEAHDIDLVAHGDDFDETRLRRMYGEPMAMGILRTVPYTAEISSSEIIQRIRGGAGGP